jgi:hypothetical protein
MSEAEKHAVLSSRRAGARLHLPGSSRVLSQGGHWAQLG